MPAHHFHARSAGELGRRAARSAVPGFREDATIPTLSSYRRYDRLNAPAREWPIGGGVQARASHPDPLGVHRARLVRRARQRLDQSRLDSGAARRCRQVRGAVARASSPPTSGCRRSACSSASRSERALPCRSASCSAGTAVRTFIDPLINFFRALPPIALIPLVIVYFGIGELAKT